MIPGQVALLGGEIAEVATIGTILSANITVSATVGVISYIGTVAYVATIGTIISGNVTASISDGQLAEVGTIGTILSGQVTASISGGELEEVSTIGYVATIGTIMFGGGGSSAFTGTIGTIMAGNVTASISGGELEEVSTIGTLMAGNVTASIAGTVLVSVQEGSIGVTVTNIAYIGTVGTLLSAIFGTVTEERYYSRVVLQDQATLFGGFTGTFDMGVWDSVTVDVIVGSIDTGSLQAALMSVDPVTEMVSSSIVSTFWLEGGERQRMTGPNALGEQLAVQATIIGTVYDFTVTIGRKS